MKNLMVNFVLIFSTAVLAQFDFTYTAKMNIKTLDGFPVKNMIVQNNINANHYHLSFNNCGGWVFPTYIPSFCWDYSKVYSKSLLTDDQGNVTFPLKRFHKSSKKWQKPRIHTFMVGLDLGCKESGGNRLIEHFYRATNCSFESINPPNVQSSDLNCVLEVTLTQMNELIEKSRKEFCVKKLKSN